MQGETKEARLFRLHIVSIAKNLKKNDPSLSQREAHKRARKLAKMDWKQTKQIILGD